MLSTNVVLPDDKEQLALTLNGKKQNIRRKDFIEFAKNIGITEISAEKMIEKIVKLKDKYIIMCKESYMPNDMKIALSGKIEGFLADESNGCYEYDLLGALKSDLVEKFYIPATDECPDVRDIVKLADETGTILAYAYLGDVGNSVTGDKKTQKFEDDYLDLLFEEIKELGFKAVTYMPSRNTKEQVERVMALCDKHGFFQISGEDINTPRQSFICMAQRDKMFSHLEEATWALIGHERAATENLNDAMFSEKTIEKYPDINDRTKYFSSIGKK